VWTARGKRSYGTKLRGGSAAHISTGPDKITKCTVNYIFESKIFTDMLDRFRDKFGIDDVDGDEESTTKVSELDPDQIIADFEEFVRMEGVDVEDEEKELVSEFERAVEIFEEIQPNLIHAQEEIVSGEVITILDKATNDEFDQWVTNNDTVIDSLEKLKEMNEDIFRQINIVDDSIEADYTEDVLDEYLTKLTHLNAIFEVSNEN
jgi:hypothetical protein